MHALWKQIRKIYCVLNYLKTCCWSNTSMLQNMQNPRIHSLLCGRNWFEKRVTLCGKYVMQATLCKEKNHVTPREDFLSSQIVLSITLSAFKFTNSNFRVLPIKSLFANIWICEVAVSFSVVSGNYLVKTLFDRW